MKSFLKEKEKKKSFENGTVHHLKSLSRTKEMMAKFRNHFHLPLLCWRAQKIAWKIMWDNGRNLFSKWKIKEHV